MKLTPFGVAARHMRMRFDLSLKSMAEAMGISSSHLSGIEYGEKRLLQKHVDSAIAYFGDKASAEEIDVLRQAAEQSKDLVHMSHLSPDARGLVAAFARRLQEGDAPPEVLTWIAKRKKKPEKLK